MGYHDEKGLSCYRQRISSNQEMYFDVCNEPASQWLDDSHRRYALRELAANVVKVDRMMIYNSASHERRKLNQWPPGARRVLQREYSR